MACIAQRVTDQWALYNGDCIEVVRDMADASVHLSLYSPPFATDDGALYHYSSSERDLSNARTYEEFFTHYEFVVRELYRLTLPGRISAVHCMDVPGDGANAGGDTFDFPGDIIRLHKRLGWRFACRYFVWKEPLAVRNRTMAKGLAHKQVVEDSSLCDNAAADQLLMFRKPGKNPEPIGHPVGLLSYAGSRQMPVELTKWRNWKGKQTENKFSHWIWRQYASAFWDDVRANNLLPYLEGEDQQDERHLHPLQLDVIERAIALWSNPGDVVLSPFAGVGSEVYGAVVNGRRGIGVELKPSYYRQAVRNLEHAAEIRATQMERQKDDLFVGLHDDEAEEQEETKETNDAEVTEEMSESNGAAEGEIDASTNPEKQPMNGNNLSATERAAVDFINRCRADDAIVEVAFGPSLKQVAEVCGVSRGRAGQVLKILEAKGVISVERDLGPKGESRLTVNDAWREGIEQPAGQSATSAQQAS